MGCSQSKESIALGLRDEIKALQQKKSQTLLELDSLKDSLKFFSMTEEEKVYSVRRLTQESEALQVEFNRIQTLTSQIEELSGKVQYLECEVKEKSQLFEQLEATCEKKKQDYLRIVEESNQIMSESTDLSFEHSRKSKNVQSISSAKKENERLQEDIARLQESLKKLEETEEKIQINKEKIDELEQMIKDIEPLIAVQNERHQYLLELENEIKEKRKVLERNLLTRDEKQYHSELLNALKGFQRKNEKADDILEQLNNFNIEELKTHKETHMLIRQTLKSEIKSLQSPTLEVCKLESKKSSLQLHSIQKTSDLEGNYQDICNKIQRKELEKSTLERQLKEYQEIIKDLEFE